jgi:trk system potassium uptake protein TrkH
VARGRARAVRRRAGSHPAQVIVGGFASVVAVGTVLLMLPLSASGPGGAPVTTALFTSTSVTCVTGLGVVDTATYWSPFGQAVIMVLGQVGGLGILTSASLLLLIVSKRLGLRRMLIAQAETNALQLGEVRTVVRGVLTLSAVVEGLTAVALTLRLWLGHGRSLGEALWQGGFLAVSAFNNVGYALYSDNLVGFADDPLILVPVALAVIAGGLGIPVWLELRRRARTPRRWSLHTKLTLVTSAILLVGGSALITTLEWGNDRTLGTLSPPLRVLNGAFLSVVSRSGGFNTFDIGGLEPESLFGVDVLMFIGGGSGSVAGGIKVTTFALLALVVWAELRGEPDVSAFGRRVPHAAVRQAFAVMALSGALVGTAVLGLTATNDLEFSDIVFEALSAFGTAGLSTGITPLLDAAGRGILIALMFVGRVGPLALGAALVLRGRPRLYDYPEERPLIG